MDNDVKRTIRAFQALKEKQKDDFLRAIREYEIKGRLEEGTTKDMSMIMGPLGKPCPYCGK